MLKNWIVLRALQMGLDILGVYGAFVLAYFLRVGWVLSSDFPFAPYAVVAGLSTLAWVGFLVFAKYYRIPPRSGNRRWFDAALVLVGGGIAVSLPLVTLFFNSDVFFSRLLSGYMLGLGMGWFVVSYGVFGMILRRQKQGKNVYRTLVVGANRVAERLIRKITENPVAPYKIVGVVDPYGMAKTVEGSVILGKLDRLEDICRQEGITAIIQCDAYEHTINLISFCEEQDIKFQFDPALRGIYEENLRVREVAGEMLISFVKRDYDDQKKRWFYRIGDAILRQVFDVD